MMMLLILLACPAPVVPDLPDLVVKGALLPGAEAMYIAVDEGLIAEIASTPLEGERILEAQLITPGLIDAHCHPAGLGRAMAELRLQDVTSFAEAQDRIRDAAAGEGWLTGRGWDQNDWPDHPGFPTAGELDLLVPDRPAALRRVDGHAVWLNSLALEAAGIDQDTPAPEGGRILDGVLVDAAMDLVEVPETPESVRRERLEAALVEIRSTGLVGVHSMGVGDETLALYESMDLPLRVWVYLSPESEAAERLKREGPWEKGRLKVVGVKAFADGALGSRGALLTEDYSDESGHRGLSMSSVEDLQGWATALLAVDAQLAVHAIGDQGVRNTLDAFAGARKAHPEKTLPLRVEHAQVVHPDDIPRFSDLGVVASMQPTHATSDMPWAEDRLGAERVHWAYAWRTLLDAGVLMAFGSDFPVEEASPSFGMWSAMYRNHEGLPPEGWHPGQKLDFATTVGLFSEGAYDALGVDGGTIRVGGPADLTLWSAREEHMGLRFEAVASLLDGELFE